MVVNGTSNVINYGICSTAAATAAKVVSCSNFGLITGAEITVKFTTTNTAANPTLNVNSTGAKAIYYRGSAISAGYLAANRTYTFRYNGSQYDLVGDLDTNTTYSAGAGLTLSGTQFKHSNSVTAGTAQGDANKTLSFGGTFTIPTVTYDAQGHITGKGTTTMTMPANPNTDTRVTQTAVDASGYTNWRPLILGSSNSGTEGFTPGTTTDGVYTTQTLSCQPSSGTIKANTFKGSLSGTATKATQDGNGNTITSYYLPKTSFEYNKELALGSSGKVCIGKFPCYDSNISVEIKSTTNITYNGTLIIATQNINTSLGGVYTAVVYGDENNTLTNSIKIGYVSGSNVFSVYIDLPPWSKNILHIQCVALRETPTDIATIVDSIPSTATIVPTNAFTHTHSYAGSSSAGGSANSAVKLDTATAGSATQPVYFTGGKPTQCNSTLGVSISGNAATATKATKDGNGNTISSTYLPLSAGESKKLTGPLGLTENINYGASLPDDGFVGQVFFVEDEYDDNYLPLSAGENKKLTGPLGLTKNVNYGTSLPSSGFTGQLFFLESDGDSDGPSLPTGGTAGQVLIKNSSTDGDAKWSNLPVASTSANGVVTTETQTFAGDKTFNNNVYFGADGSYGYVDSNGVHGAMWNDYAEFRNQFEDIEPGYCVASTDDGKVYKTTEKFQACDGIVSDTFGFSIGKTDECKTPLAVAGRVLAYFYGNREDYHAGDTVCAGPEGKVMKMTREEIREWPDRIVGIVSEIPEYERWGSGNVEVNNRIWIKVK